MHHNLTDVPGILLGHHTNRQGWTGCTVALAPTGAVAGVDVRGSAPGTRETDLLDPIHRVQQVHAVLLTGGSAFGLDAAAGVMRYLEERRIGYDVGVTVVPIVPAAVIFDLALGDPNARPGSAEAYAACASATAGPQPEGNAGAGTGATVGKIFGMGQAMKGGLGHSAIRLASGVTVAALAVVNAFGDVIDPGTGEILAGARNPITGRPVDTARLLREGREVGNFGAGARPDLPRRGALPPREEGAAGLDQPDDPRAIMNTTLAIVATDAQLTKAQATKLAQVAHDGLARTIRPVHTTFDGDTIFALSTGSERASLDALGAAAADAVATAVVRAVRAAEPVGAIPGLGGSSGSASGE